MPELSLTTLNILAVSKIILFAYLGITIFLIWKNNKPYWHLITITLAMAAFYFVLAIKLQKMFWGDNGDEVFIFAFLTKVLHGQYFSDFYYSWLPPFYPPLYFWLTGTIARLFTQNGIQAAKVGVLGALITWFIGTYFWQKLYWQKVAKKEENKEIHKSPWFWLLLPMIFLITLDFDTIILKPYETLSALGSIILIGLIAESLEWDKWRWPNYLFLGLSSGLLFLTYYFWWFILIPAFIVLALLTKQKRKNISRLIILGLIIFAVAAIYLAPLILSYCKYGLQNWQAAFFVPQDLTTFTPWLNLSLKTIIFVLGLTGLIFFTKQKFIKASLITFIFCYVYQLANIIVFVFGHKPAQASKPFLFLGTACLAVGATYLLIHAYQKYISHLKIESQKLTVIAAVIIFLPLLPMIKFIDDPVILKQVETDFKAPATKYLSTKIANEIPDYQTRTWLSSGAPELNAYLPLSYYIAHNPHFSHQAVIYSQRLGLVAKLTETSKPEDFMTLINKTEPQVSGLILYNDNESKNYPLFFWQDNYPNGGKELRLDLNKNLISEKYWVKKFQDKDWTIFIRK